jgi:hypothetical protein
MVQLPAMECPTETSPTVIKVATMMDRQADGAMVSF